MRMEDRAFIENLESYGQSLIRIQDHTVGDRNIHSIAVGDPSLPTIFFVHGSPGSAENFQVYLADTSLAKQAQLVAIDRPGFGFSDYGTVERSVEEQAALLAEALKAATQKPAILVGHSYGGPVIARMAMDYPELVKSLVIIAGSISPELEPREWWRPVVDFPLVRWILPASLRVSNQEIHALYDELERMMPLWKTIQCPVIVFQGESDSLVPAGNADFAALMVPDSLVTIKMVELGDHFIVWSRKNEVVKILETQLAQ